MTVDNSNYSLNLKENIILASLLEQGAILLRSKLTNLDENLIRALARAY